LAHRQLEGELMDDPGVDPRAHADALRGLGRINGLSRTGAALWPAVERILRSRPDGPGPSVHSGHPGPLGQPRTLLDIATGGGDVAIALSRLARRKGYPLTVEGCDISPTALGFATGQAARASASVHFFRLDVLSESFPCHYDIITATLFLHHLTDGQIVGLLGKLSAHADHVVISDLIRNRTGYCLATLGTRLLSRSRIVHVDGQRSVRAALTLAEARGLTHRAGLEGATFRRHWPSRFLMTWSRCQPASGASHAN